MSNKITNVKTSEEKVLSTLEAEGHEIAKLFLTIDKRDKGNLTKDLPSFLALGQLIATLKRESEAGRISSDRLKDCGINKIDKRRRSEALWFADNEKSVNAFKAKSKKGFTSLSALQRAWKEAQPKDEVLEPETSDPVSEGEQGEPVASVVTHNEISVAESVIELCKLHGINLAQVTELLQEHCDVTETSIWDTEDTGFGIQVQMDVDKLPTPEALAS